MPSTRSQTTRTTRSSSRASVQTGPGTSTSVKRRQTKAKSKTSSIPKPSALRSDPDNKGKIRRILWNLAEKYFPWFKIILEPFSYNETVVSAIIMAMLVLYLFWSFRITIINAVTVLWQKPVTADLPSVYFNDAVSYHFTKCPYEAMKRHQCILKNQDGKNTIFIEGPASGRTKSSYANELGVCLFDALKQSKQDNRPVDVITINVSSESFCVMKSIYDAILDLCGSQKADCIQQIKDELDLTRDLFLSESYSSETEMKLKFLFTKLNELLMHQSK